MSDGVLYPCPICQSSCQRDYDMLDGWALLEDYIDCPNNHYHYSYIHGMSTVYLGPQTMWTWDDRWETVVERETRRKEIETEIAKQKQLWQTK